MAIGSWGSGDAVTGNGTVGIGSWGSDGVTGGSWGSDGSTVGVSNMGGVDSGLDNGLLDGVDVLLNDWGLDNLLDWVDLEGLGNIDWDWDLDGVWLVDVLDDIVWSLNWGWDWDWDVIWDLVDVQLWDNVGLDWGDSGVGADWGGDLLLGDGISWGWAKVHWCWWDGSIGSWVWQRSQRQWAGGFGVDWGTSDVAVWGWLLNSLTGSSVLVSNLDGLGANLDGAVSDNTMLNVGLGDGWASMDSFVDGGWANSNTTMGVAKGSWGSGVADTSKADTVVARGSGAQSDAERQDQKLCHVSLSVL